VVNTPDEKRESELEQQTHHVFEQQVASLDAHTLSRLNQARQTALDVARKRNVLMPRWLVPVGSVAALALVVLVFHSTRESLPGNSSAQSISALEDMEIIASADDIDLLQDVDFYDSLDSVDSGESQAG